MGKFIIGLITGIVLGIVGHMIYVDISSDQYISRGVDYRWR